MPGQAQTVGFRSKRDGTVPVIDVQAHPYERNHPGRPWAGELHGPSSTAGKEMAAAMDRVGVGAAILVSSFNLYRPGTDA